MSIEVGDEGVDPSYLLADGQLNTNFEVQLFTSHFSTGAVTCQLLMITEFENKTLVAIPQSMWHRTVSNRLMVSGVFSRPTLVEVLASDLYNPMVQEEDVKMKVWVGFLHPDALIDLEPYAAVSMCNHYFLRENGKVLIPFPDSLIAAANEHFAFFSAQEEEDMPVADDEDEAPLAQMLVASEADGTPLGELESGSATVEGRMKRMEGVLDTLQTAVTTQMSGRTSATAPTPKKTARLKPAPTMPSSSTALSRVDNVYPHLDPGVVQAAKQAGIDHESLVQMEKVVLNNAKARKTADPHKNIVLDPLSEVDEDRNDDQLVEGGASGFQADPMATSLEKLANIMELLTEDKTKRIGRSKLDAALDSPKRQGPMFRPWVPARSPQQHVELFVRPSWITPRRFTC